MANVNSNVRINKFDNLKGFAIFLIVLGHLCYIGGTFKSIYILRNFLYLVHLPIFFFVSGYFSKIGPDEPVKAFKRLFIPYLVFCLLWELFNYFFLNEPISSTIFIDPGWGLWFLISLFTMKLSLPILDRLRYPLLITIICAILIGFIDSMVLGISRTFVFLPIFVIGFKYKDYKLMIKEKFKTIDSLLENKYVLIGIGFISLAISVYMAWALKFDVINMKHVYHNIGHDILIRCILLILTTTNALIISKFMTNSKTVLTQYGINSLTVYLLHLYVYKILDILFKGFLREHEKICILFLIFATCLTVHILSRDIFTKILNKIFDSIYNLMAGVFKS